MKTWLWIMFVVWLIWLIVFILPLKGKWWVIDYKYRGNMEGHSEKLSYFRYWVLRNKNKIDKKFVDWRTE